MTSAYLINATFEFDSISPIFLLTCLKSIVSVKIIYLLLRFILAEQKKHAKGGTGERIKPICDKVIVHNNIFFEKFNSGEDLNGLEEELIGLFACRHGPITIYVVSTQVGFRKQVQGTWSIVLVDGASVIAFSSTVTHPQRSTNGTPGRRIFDQ